MHRLRPFPALALLALLSAACGEGSRCEVYCDTQLREQLISEYDVDEDVACQTGAVEVAWNCEDCAAALRSDYGVQPVSIEEMCADPAFGPF